MGQFSVEKPVLPGSLLSGNQHASSEKTGREDLEAHEILNAAARAGRAGHLANGVVLLVPEPIISFADDKPLDVDVVTKLRSILPEDDRCVAITDPLEVVLDRLAVGHKLDRDVLYTVNRMAVLEETEGDEKSVPLFSLQRSLAAFSARAKGAEADFDKKVAVLKSAIEASAATGHDTTLSILVSQSGLPRDILERLRKRIADQKGSLPESVADWIKWILDWLGSDEEARALLLFDVSGAILAATGNKKTAPLTAASLGALAPGVLASRSSASRNRSDFGRRSRFRIGKVEGLPACTRVGEHRHPARTIVCHGAGSPRRRTG